MHNYRIIAFRHQIGGPMPHHTAILRHHTNLKEVVLQVILIISIANSLEYSFFWYFTRIISICIYDVDNSHILSFLEVYVVYHVLCIVLNKF